MRLEFHGDELMERFPFVRVPDGDYEVRTTAYPEDAEPFDFMWPVTVRDGTLTAHKIEDLQPITPCLIS